MNISFLGPICQSVINSFPGCIFVTNGRIYLGIGSNERSWRVHIFFDTFSHRKLAENAQKL